MSISHVMSGGRYVDARPRFSTRLFSSRLLACAIASTAVPAFAADVSDIGAPGSPGSIGLVGRPGGNGQNAGAILTSHDFFNTVAATGGKGGNGGASLLLVVPGGNGGTGGTATAHQRSANMPFEAFVDSEGAATVTATGGNGGNGGGLIRGDGGAGGVADAFSRVNAAAGGALGSFILQSTNVNGVGGKGGTGRNGGAGGNSKALAILTGPSDGSSIAARSQGGDGGAATFNGGRGGNASAVTSYDGGGQPSDNFVVSEAVGGDGGNSLLGRNGNGGHAVANASGRHGSRDLGVSVSANARGGDSGAGGTALPFSQQGKGGNAFANAIAEAVNFPTSAQADAHAQGGAGVVRGGDAVASATALGPFAGSSAVATGGAGRQAGAAVATSITSNDYFGFVDASATATSADKFVRDVVVNASVGQDFETSLPVPATVFTQARTGGTSAVIARAPAPAVEPGVVARAAAGPGAAEVTASLAGNTAIAGQAATGTVWGLGDFATNAFDGEGGIVNPFDSIDATTTFTFDVSQRAPSNLWLGLLDSSLPADALGEFHFSLAGEGSTLFEQNFSGSDFLTFFDDRLFDLGAWSSLVSSDGLFDLAVTFSGVVPEIRFAFGDTTGGSTSVPEPSVLVMLLTGLLGIGLARRRR